MGAPESIPATVVTGMAAEPVAAVVDGLLARADRLVVLSYRSTPDGELVCSVRDSDGRQEIRTLPAGCPAAGMVADSAGELRRLACSGRYDTLLLQLSGGWDPALVLAGLTDGDPLGEHARVDTVLTVIDSDSVPRDLGSTDTLADPGLGLTGADRRTLAPLLACQVETADAVLLLEGAAQPDPAAVLVDRLVPSAALLRAVDPYDLPPAAVLGTGRFDRERLDPFADCGPLDPRWTGTVERDGLGTVQFSARRPFHPAQHLAFTGPGLDADLITARLRNCLLADGELAAGPDGWREFADPLTAGAGRHRRGAR